MQRQLTRAVGAIVTACAIASDQSLSLNNSSLKLKAIHPVLYLFPSFHEGGNRRFRLLIGSLHASVCLARLLKV